MKAIENQIAINNQAIAEQTAIVEMCKEKYAAYRRGEMTWDEYYDFECPNGRSIQDTAEEFISDLKVWNKVLSGEKMYFNGSYYTDVHAFELLSVKSKNEFVIREMKATMCGEPYSNDWKIESNPNGRVTIATLRKTKRGYRCFEKGNKGYEFGISTQPHYYYDYTY